MKVGVALDRLAKAICATAAILIFACFVVVMAWTWVERPGIAAVMSLVLVVLWAVMRVARMGGE